MLDYESLYYELKDKCNKLADKADYITLPFHVESHIHNPIHCRRVLIYSVMLGNLYGLSDSEIDILVNASLYHDIGRINDLTDPYHGEKSSVLFYNVYKDAPKEIGLLMKYHCRDDKYGLEAIKNFFDDNERTKLLFNIFKDSDGLDRIRDSKEWLDINQLRTEHGKNMVGFADKLINGKISM